MESNFLKENSLDNKKYFLEDTWNTFLNISTTEIGKRVTDGWFKSLKLISWNYNSKIAEINAPNEFVSKWILKNYKITIEKILARIFGEKNVYINVFFENTKTNFLKPASLYKESSENQNKGKAEKNFKNKIVSSKINSKNTFDKFFFGNDNEIAYSAAKYFLEKNDITYNSLFIHGASGTGKSHLIQAIANYLEKSNANFVYQTSDIFIQNYINSVKSNKIDQFEREYQAIDYLLIDDIQVLAKKTQTQEIFLKIIMNFQLKKKKIVVTSDLIPSQIKGLLERLRSRFEGGLIVDLSMPSQETIMKIITEKIKDYNLNISDESVFFVASIVKNSIREIEGILIKLSTYYSITKKELTFDVISKIFQKFNNEFLEEDPFVQKIFSLITRKFNIKIEEIKSLSRKKSLCRIRHLAMYFIRKYSKKSLKEISEIFHRSDHTTIIHANKKIEKIKKEDEKFSQIITILEKDIEKRYLK